MSSNIKSEPTQITGFCYVSNLLEYLNENINKGYIMTHCISLLPCTAGFVIIFEKDPKQLDKFL